MDSWSAIAPMLIGFHQTAPQRSGEAKALPAAPGPIVTLSNCAAKAGAIAQGLLQYLSVVFPRLVWNSFGSWLRTIRPGIPPSEFVVGNVMRQTIPDFLVNCAKTNSLANSSLTGKIPTI